jgi:predicted RNA-binding protein with PUA domain
MKASKVEETPGAEMREASSAVTRLLRSRLQNEMGHLRSYEILLKLTGGG